MRKTNFCCFNYANWSLKPKAKVYPNFCWFWEFFLHKRNFRLRKRNELGINTFCKKYQNYFVPKLISSNGHPIFCIRFVNWFGGMLLIWLKSNSRYGPVPFTQKNWLLNSASNGTSLMPLFTTARYVNRPLRDANASGLMVVRLVHWIWSESEPEVTVKLIEFAGIEEYWKNAQ